MRVTQQDIAKIAMVSQATVSRVLAGDERVETDIRDRVVAVMREHNYQPDVRARSLRIRRSGLIGLVVKRPQGGLSDDPFFSRLISHIMDFLAEKPYHLCVEMVTSSSSQEAVYDEMLRTRRVDGVILVESEASDERIHRLQAEGFPFVLIGNPVRDVWGSDNELWSIDNDNILASELATDHLMQMGYRNIGMLAGPKGVTVSEDRIMGYENVLTRVNLKPRMWNSNFGFESAKEVAAKILAENTVDALVVLDDYMAMGAVVAARDAGIEVPNKLGIVGFNDSSFCTFIEGGLTSVSLNIGEMVKIATGRLLKIIEKRPIYGDRRVIVPCELIGRNSSKKVKS